jgi:amidophosphoribosyltransferase
MVKLDDTTERYPLLVDDVISATQRLLDINAQGVYHLSTHEPYTKYEFGKRVVDIFDIDGELVPIEGDSLVERPTSIELETTKIERLGVTIQSVEQGLNTVKHQRGCSFKTIYSFKPDKLVKGESASMIRVQLGKELGREDDLDADIVVPVPESGIYSATGYADETGIPLYHGIIRDYETEKTLYEPNIEDRTRMLRKKLVAVDDMLKGNRVVIVDEAIISGLTLSAVIDKCQTAGASEVHVRIPSPPMRTQCEFGVLSADADLLVSNDLESMDDIQTQLQDDFSMTSIRYLPLNRFEQVVPSDYGFTCIECFKGGKQ